MRITRGCAFRYANLLYGNCDPEIVKGVHIVGELFRYRNGLFLELALEMSDELSREFIHCCAGMKKVSRVSTKVCRVSNNNSSFMSLGWLWRGTPTVRNNVMAEIVKLAPRAQIELNRILPMEYVELWPLPESLRSGGVTRIGPCRVSQSYNRRFFEQLRGQSIDALKPTRDVLANEVVWPLSMKPSRTADLYIPGCRIPYE